MSKNMVINGQTDIFSMFGLVDEVAEQRKHEEEERRRQAEELKKKVEASKTNSSSSKNEKKDKKDAFEVNENTVIRYFGESIEIQTYFDAEEIAEGVLIKNKEDKESRVKIDGEMLRKRMEKDFPEMVKGMTDMVYLKDKNLVVPVMQAKKKGVYNCTKETSSTEDVSFSLPYKIPFSILRDFIAVAKMFGDHELEVHADIYMNKSFQFLLDFPQQLISKYNCEVTEEPLYHAQRLKDEYGKIAEIHSHHKMAPIPSSQDNRSERAPGRIYAIVGFTNKTFPDVTIRRFVSVDFGWENLKYLDVFEDPYFAIPSLDMSNFTIVENL